MTGGKARAVVFDLDGTLIDSAVDIGTCLNQTLSEAGFGQIGPEQVRRMIGSGAHVLLEQALASLGAPLVDGQVTGLVERFEEHYLQLGAGQSRLFEGGALLLQDLRRRDVPLGICTNKPDEVTRVIVRDLGIAGCFSAVRGVLADVPRKPAPDMLLRVLDELGCRPQDALMVGDSIVDVEMARKAGVPVIVVSFGYTQVPASELGADAVIDTLTDVASWVA